MTPQIEKIEKNTRAFALFNLGFRPFFLFAAIFSIFTINLSLVQFSGKTILSSYYSIVAWHAHEMLFGYTVAVIAGFLFTAVGNWTSMKVINGWQLVLVSLVFLIGRFSPFFTELPHWSIALSDLIFIPLLALIISVPIVRAKQWSNILFIPILLLMAVANLFVHLGALGVISISDVTGSRVMLYLVVLLIVIMSGRVIPFFTEKGIYGVTTKKWTWIERLAPFSILLLLVSDVLYDDKTLAGYLALFATVVHGIRLIGWYSNKIWLVPLVWILHVAYGWFIVGFVIQSLVLLAFDGSLTSYHAMTVGGIGIITLGMMVRVSTGHTGREMKINKWMLLSFILINIAAVVRVVFPLFFQENYLQLVQVAGWLWAAAFVIFLVTFTPIWTGQRADGREG